VLFQHDRRDNHSGKRKDDDENSKSFHVCLDILKPSPFHILIPAL
jgi:hypothetical protein